MFFESVRIIPTRVAKFRSAWTQERESSDIRDYCALHNSQRDTYAVREGLFRLSW